MLKIGKNLTAAISCRITNLAMALLSLCLMFLSITGCTSSGNEIKKVYTDKEEILSIFNNVSVFRKRLRGHIFLYTYNGGKQNQYVFTANQNRYFLLRDSISFTPDVVLTIDRDQENSINYKKQLGEKASFYIKKMDSLNIGDISSEFFSYGIDFKIYMKTKGVLIHVPDIKKVDNPQWVNYIKSMQKLNENWYYSNEGEE